MQQTINSYNLYKVPSTNNPSAYNGSAQFVIGSGVFEIEGSSMEIQFNGVTGAAGTSRLYARSDVCVAVQAPTIVTFDGNQRGQYLNLSVAQLAYSQAMPSWEGVPLDIAQADGTGAITKKLWSNLGQSSATATKYRKAYPLRMFFPGIFNSSDKYFAINSVGNITMNLGSTALTDCLAVQATQAAAGVSGILAPVAACTGVEFILNLKRVTNQVEEAQASISPHITCFLQQSQPLGTGVTFNQTFGANQISDFQQLVIAPQAAQTQFTLEEIQIANAQIAVSYALSVQRCGVTIIQTNDIGNVSEATAQLQLVRGCHKPSYNNLIATFDTLFSNCNVQTQFQLATAFTTVMQVYLAYSYMMQSM